MNIKILFSLLIALLLCAHPTAQSQTNTNAIVIIHANVAHLIAGQTVIELKGRKIIVDVPMGRIAETEEITNAVLWLCSDEASFVTGQALAPDGGWMAK